MPSHGQPSLPPTTSVQGHLARTTIVLPTPGFGSDVLGHGWLSETGSTVLRPASLGSFAGDTVSVAVELA